MRPSSPTGPDSLSLSLLPLSRAYRLAHNSQNETSIPDVRSASSTLQSAVSMRLRCWLCTTVHSAGLSLRLALPTLVDISKGEAPEPAGMVRCMHRAPTRPLPLLCISGGLLNTKCSVVCTSARAGELFDSSDVCTRPAVGRLFTVFTGGALVGAANNSGLLPPEIEGGVLFVRSRASKGGRCSRTRSRCGCCGLGRAQADLYNNNVPKTSI